MYRVYIETKTGEIYSNPHDFSHAGQAHGYLWEHEADDDFKKGMIVIINEVGDEELFYGEGLSERDGNLRGRSV